jgi:hypothetical protein
LSPPFAFALCAFGDLELHNDSTVARIEEPEGPDREGGHVASHGNLRVLDHAVVRGSAVVGGDLHLANHGLITGDVWVAGDIELENRGRVDGRLNAVEPPPRPCDCGYDLDAALAQAAMVNDNVVLEADPELASSLVDGGLLLDDEATMALPAGDYFLSYVAIEGHASLVLTGGLVRLFVTGGVEIGNHATVAATAGSGLLVVSGASSVEAEHHDHGDDEPDDHGDGEGDSGRERHRGGRDEGHADEGHGHDGDDGDEGCDDDEADHSHDPWKELDGAVVIKNNSVSRLFVYAPFARVEVENNATLTGAIVGRDIVLDNKGKVRFEGSQPSAPQLECSGVTP